MGDHSIVRGVSLVAALMLLVSLARTTPALAGPPAPVFNRAPLKEKPYAELPLGAIRARGWLQDELRRMAGGMTGHLDEWYPEVAGPRNAWLGGDGDTWERGPYWIDGLYPLACLLDDDRLRAKALPWIEWTLANQREDGSIGPVGIAEADRKAPPPEGAQVAAADDWWPRMVMLKILQQHYMATGDERVIAALRRYFRYQSQALPKEPLDFRTFWGAQRGGDNLLVVLWCYNVTGEKWLLELAGVVAEQTIPVTEWFEGRDKLMLQGNHPDAFHCVNLAQAMKTPVVRWQQDGDPRHLAAVKQGFADIDLLHGQPHGLFGGDEFLHGNGLDRGSELCTAVEMMFSLETMLEATGDVAFADRLEQVAFNALPTQASDDHRTRQYFQQANQVQVTAGDRNFFNDGGERLVYGLLQGYPCCTCNMHQGWPKFVQHLWFASVDNGIAALVYAPSSVTAEVADGQRVTIVEETGYPFQDSVRFTMET